MSINYTPRTFVAGEVETALIFNTEVRDAMTGIQAAWTAYTPVWGGTTTNPVIGNGTIVGRWNRMGKTSDPWVQITVGSTTTFGSGSYVVSTPATMLFTRWGRAIGDFFDSSASARFPLSATEFTTTQVLLQAWPGVAGAAMANVSPTVPVVWATGDVATLQFRPELA